MRRTPIVLAATAAGLAGVLGFHTKPAKVAVGVSPAGTTGAAATGGTAAGSSTGSGATRAPAPATTAPARSSSAGRRSATGTRSATGSVVNYNYGLMSVKVTASGTKITSVTIATLDDGGNSLSQSIDQQSIPLLEQQAVRAQSASIQGVSGASYTSAGFVQSLQFALSKLGIK
ncbi:MAG: FMN-binding protein [Actinomycetota bacterium]|nr:FMN-binding protein [Actinomycetota bacterium]